MATTKESCKCALMSAATATVCGIVYPRRFETLHRVVALPVEAEPVERKFVPRRIWETLSPYVKNVSPLVMRERRRALLKKHAQMAKEDAIIDKRLARREAWKETRRVRREIAQAARVEPATTEADGIIPAFAPFEYTYSEVAATPPLVFPPRGGR